VGILCSKTMPPLRIATMTLLKLIERERHMGAS
jgi:hypothetical protein